VSFSLPKGSRTVLVGANGAGKSTLLKILGGRHMHDDSAVFVIGHNAFRAVGVLNHARQYLDPNWGLRTVAFAGCGVAYQADIPIRSMMLKLQEEFPERRDMLMELLEIDPEWRMHKVSDGQRRRVQLFLAFLRPFSVLFLDEVTAVLDLLCRQRLLAFLKRECEEREVTMVYATHIFDGLDDWATHMLWLKKYPVAGTVGFYGQIETVPGWQELHAAGNVSPMLKVVETWFLAERAEQQAARKEAAPGEVPADTKMLEEEGGENAIETKLTASNYGAGGYASGRVMQTVTREGGGFDGGRMYNYW